MSKKREIPSWQQKKDTQDATDKTAQSPSSISTETASSRSVLLEHAAKFLQDPSIKDAALKRKTEFLEEKGLSEEEIQSLLQDNSQPSSAPSDLKTIHDSTTSATASNREPIEASSPREQKRDTPPIITYPEFLLRPEKPPPLITFQRLLYAVYGLSAISATVYGANKYLVEPMLSSLTESRHDLFETTKSQLDTLNRKLEANVSSVPISSHKASHRTGESKEDEDDDSSIASDPTELFHRDIATQTTPSLKRSTSLSTSGDSNGTPSSPQDTPASERSAQLTSTQTNRLNTIRSNLTYLLANEDTTSQDDDLTTTNPSTSTYDFTATYRDSSNLYPTSTSSLSTQTSSHLKDLQTYLETITYSPHHRFNSTTSSTNPSSSATSSMTAAAAAGGNDFLARSSFASASLVNNNTSSTGGSTSASADAADEVVRLKQEIRSLKGTLLSSRNFPMAPPGGSSTGIGVASR